MAQHFTVDRPTTKPRGGFKTRTGGYAQAKRFWVCKQCDQLHQQKPKTCANCEEKAFYYFDSQKEVKRYYVLIRRATRGQIKNLIVKPKFDFPMTGPDGRETTPFKYVADFEYCSNGQRVVEDVKPSQDRRSWDPVFKLKQRSMIARYGLEVSIVTNPEI